MAKQAKLNGKNVYIVRTGAKNTRVKDLGANGNGKGKARLVETSKLTNIKDIAA